MLRRLKPLYWLYNLFRPQALAHNVAAYRKLDLSKKYFSSVSSADFIGVEPGKLSGTYTPPAVTETAFYKQADPVTRASIDRYDQDGFCVIKRFLNGDTVDHINGAVDRMVDSGEITFTYRTKLMFAVRKSAVIADPFEDRDWLDLLNSLIGGRARLFQSINFLEGSQQRTHSDSIHMTTFPLGGLLGVWIALEDIDADSGPLHYYPGSHRLPYFLNKDYGNEGNTLTIGDREYREYEDLIAKKLLDTEFPKEVLLAKKGDVLIWHANLLHGGEPVTDPSKSRKSMVLHYFDDTRVCYHEITQRPALFA